MQNWQTIAIAAAAVLVVAIAAWLINEKRRSRHLQDHFGSEYDRTVTELGGRRQAESELARREQRVRNLKVRPLSLLDRQRLRARWNQCQALFVDDPAGAVDEADHLLTDLVRARGYSADNPHDRLADISAAYPQHIAHYRLACEIMARHQNEGAPIEDLREAFIHYRAVFDEILREQDEELKRAS
jgi:hypothetical protein